MDIRQTMVKERKGILERMDDATLAEQIGNYFSANATMPGEGSLKKEASEIRKYAEIAVSEEQYDPDNLMTNDRRAAMEDKFAEVCVKSTRLKNAHIIDGKTAADMAWTDGEDLGKGKTRYQLTGEIYRINGTEKETIRASFANGLMTADIPEKFIEAHPYVVGKNITVEAVDYSNGKGKNVTYDMYVDLMQGNDFDRTLAEERYTPNMDADVMSRISDKFDAYVPGMGKAPTLGGEMVRAMSRIGYRYLNDGDKLNDGYGRETVNPAARFLMEKGSPEVKASLEAMWAPYSGDYFSDADYEGMLSNLGEALMDQFEDQPELFTTPNEEDMHDYADKYEDRDDSYDEEEEEYYEEEEEDEYEDEEDYDDFADAVDSLGTEEGLEM